MLLVLYYCVALVLFANAAELNKPPINVTTDVVTPDVNLNTDVMAPDVNLAPEINLAPDAGLSHDASLTPDALNLMAKELLHLPHSDATEDQDAQAFFTQPVGVLDYKGLKVPILRAPDQSESIFWLPPTISFVKNSAAVVQNPFSGSYVLSFNLTIFNRAMLETANSLAKSKLGSKAEIRPLPAYRFKLKPLFANVSRRFDIPNYWSTRVRFDNNTLKFSLACLSTDVCRHLAEKVNGNTNLIQDAFAVETIVDNQVGKMGSDDKSEDTTKRLGWRIQADMSRLDALNKASSISFRSFLLPTNPLTGKPNPAPAPGPNPYKDWIVIQNRTAFTCNSSYSSGTCVYPLSMYRNWAQFQNGFHSTRGDVWIGLERIHQLTTSGRYKLRIEFSFKNRTRGWAEYSNFYLGSKVDRYRFHTEKFLGGSNGDPFFRKCGSNDYSRYSPIGHQFATWNSDVVPLSSEPYCRKRNYTNSADNYKGLAYNYDSGWWLCGGISYATILNKRADPYFYTCINSRLYGRYTIRDSAMMIQKY